MPSSARALNRRQCLSLTTAAVAAPWVWGQSGYPTKPVTVIVPYTAGGSSDVGARLYVNELGKALGQPIVIDNVAGAGGVLGVQKLLRSPPDGHTLIYGDVSVCVLVPLINPAAGYKTEDFTPVALTGATPGAIVVRPDFPADTMEQWIAYARKNPGKLSFGSPGVGTFQHVVGETIKSRTGTFMLHIPYRGGANIVNDVVAGQIDIGITSVVNVLGMVAQGRAKMLGVTSAERVSVIPQVPSLSETPSLKGLDLQTWGMFLGPKGLPDAVVQKLNSAIHAITQSPGMAEQRRKMGSTAAGAMSPAQTQSFLLNERETYRVAASRIKPE